MHGDDCDDCLHDEGRIMEKMNRHHTFYARAWYRTPLLRMLRNHPLAITTMDKEAHQELHASVPAPPRPSPDIAIRCISLLDEIRDSGLIDPVNIHLALSEELLQSRDRVATRIGYNILRQTAYIAEGLYENKN